MSNASNIDWNAVRRVADENLALCKVLLQAVDAAAPGQPVAPPRRSHETGQLVAELVADWFRFPLKMLKAKGRNGEQTWARQVAMCLMREYTTMSTPQVERFFGRTHGCLFNAEKVFRNRLDTEPATRDDIAQLRQFINRRLT